MAYFRYSLLTMTTRKAPHLALALGTAITCASASELDFRELLPERFDKANIIQEAEYNVWGTNILRGKDEKYHAIYSRWPKSRGHLAWVTHSEIAHAVSDNLTGPYVFKNLVLPPRGKEFWDGDCTHNPHVLEYDGKYYLYHMGNRGSGYWDDTPVDRMPKFEDEEWWVNRNNQRIGLAVTHDLNGEWQRSDAPFVDVKEGRRMVSTPVVSIRPDGKFLMVYKYVVEQAGRVGGRVVHVTALSDAPTGPFVDTGVPFIVNDEARFAIDDHVQWHQNGGYYCLGKDHDGSLTDFPKGSMLLFESDALGLDWKLSKNPLVVKAGEIKWTDNTSIRCQRTADMPKIYIEDGVPRALVIAALPKDSEDSFSLVIPLANQVLDNAVVSDAYKGE